MTSKGLGGHSEISNLDYPGIHVHTASNGLQGHEGPPNNLRDHLTSYMKSATLITLVFMCILPQMASEAMATSKQPQRSFDLRFEISKLNYPGIHVHIASNGLLRPWRPLNKPQRSNDLRFEISNLEYPGIHVHIVSNGL